MRKLGIVLMAAGMIFAASCTNNDNNGSTTTTSSTVTTTSSTVTTTSSTVTTSPKVATTVDVTEKDFDIDLNNSNVDSGTVTFNVTNHGPSTHEFVIFKTDLDESQLPLSASSSIDENAPGVTHVDEIEGIEANSTKSLSVDLEPGHYVLVCNLPAHYGLGMHVAFDVE